MTMLARHDDISYIACTNPEAAASSLSDVSILLPVPKPLLLALYFSADIKDGNAGAQGAA